MSTLTRYFDRLAHTAVRQSIVGCEVGHRILMIDTGLSYIRSKPSCPACKYRYQRVKTARWWPVGPIAADGTQPGRIDLLLACGHLQHDDDDLLHLGRGLVHLLVNTDVFCLKCSDPVDLL